MDDITKSLEFVCSITLPIILDSHINKSHVHGFGLFTEKKILKGDILCLLDGQVISKNKYNEIQEIMTSKVGKYKNYFFMECNYISKDKIIARTLRTSYSYINHSRTPNVALDYFPLKVVALTNIDKGEEILIDYRKEPLTEEYLMRSDKTFL